MEPIPQPAFRGPWCVKGQGRGSLATCLSPCGQTLRRQRRYHGNSSLPISPEAIRRVWSWFLECLPTNPFVLPVSSAGSFGAKETPVRRCGVAVSHRRGCVRHGRAEVSGRCEVKVNPGSAGKAATQRARPTDPESVASIVIASQGAVSSVLAGAGPGDKAGPDPQPDTPRSQAAHHLPRGPASGSWKDWKSPEPHAAQRWARTHTRTDVGAPWPPSSPALSAPPGSEMGQGTRDPEGGAGPSCVSPGSRASFLGTGRQPCVAHTRPSSTVETKPEQTKRHDQAGGS